MLNMKNKIANNITGNEKINVLGKNNLIDMINKNSNKEDDLMSKVLNNCSTKIIIEEPLEYILDKSLLEKHNTPSFKEAISKTMRTSPETIMIGEIRDNVYTSVHALAASGIIENIEEYAPLKNKNVKLYMKSQKNGEEKIIDSTSRKNIKRKNILDI